MFFGNHTMFLVPSKGHKRLPLGGTWVAQANNLLIFVFVKQLNCRSFKLIITKKTMIKNMIFSLDINYFFFCF